MSDVKFKFFENECYMSWSEGKQRNTVLCGMDGKARKCKIRLAGIDFTASSTAAWENENTLSVWVRPLESVCQRLFKFVFSENKVKVIPRSFPDTKNMLTAISAEVSMFIKYPVIVKIVNFGLMKCNILLESKNTGKIC